MAYNLSWLANTAAGGGDNWPNGTVNASSNSRDDVNTAITNASDGQVVVIPNGSVTWSSGITTSKQILVRATTINPTSGGRSNQSLTITNNSASPLFNFTTGNSYPVGIAGIKFAEGTQATNYVRFNGSGTKIGIMYDCYCEAADRSGSATDVAIIANLQLGGLFWRNMVVGDMTANGGQGPLNACIYIDSPRGWQTASTMGDLDTDGNINTYWEDGYMQNVAQAPDVDQGGRYVGRYSTFDGVFQLTHGFSSGTYVGGRHFELYNNTFSVTTQARNHQGRYVWLRAGPAAITDNTVNNASFPGEYGSCRMLDMGDNTTPGTYPMSSQVGYGHNGTTDVQEPVYVWSQSGAQGYAWAVTPSPDWSGMIQQNRDFYVNNGSKPSYTKYTYPHPLVAGCPTS